MNHPNPSDDDQTYCGYCDNKHHPDLECDAYLEACRQEGAQAVRDYQPVHPERDHGFGVPPEPTEPPTAKACEPIDGIKPVCPACGCESLHEIRQPVEAPSLLRVPEGSRAVGLYLGCPACPYASPMAVTAVPQ